MRRVSGMSAAVRGLSCMAIVGWFWGSGVQSASAAIFTLTDDNSVSQFDTANPAGNFNWFVDGTDRLSQQAFWYRIGNVAEQSAHLLPIGVQGTTDSNFDGNPDTLFVRYNGPGFQLDIRYTLDGGALLSNASDMAEQISITNLLGTPLDFHFFQYSNFDLSAGNDSIVFTNANSVRQSGGTSTLTETVVTPVPSHHEAYAVPVTLNKLNDAAATTLTDLPAIGTSIGPGDLTWTYEWDISIPVGGTFQISKDKNLSASIPEPSTVGILLGLSAGFLLRPLNRKRRLCP